jgi:hypothetical protein
MPVFRCTHERRPGDNKTMVHTGSQCTDEWNQDNSCHLFQKSWKFISCEEVHGALEFVDDETIRLVDPSDIPEGEARER